MESFLWFQNRIEIVPLADWQENEETALSRWRINGQIHIPLLNIKVVEIAL